MYPLLSALKLTPSSTGASGPPSTTAGTAVIGQMVQGHAEAPKAGNKRKRNANKTLTFIAIFSRPFFPIAIAVFLSLRKMRSCVPVHFGKSGGSGKETRNDPPRDKRLDLSGAGFNRSNGFACNPTLPNKHD